MRIDRARARRCRSRQIRQTIRSAMEPARGPKGRAFIEGLTTDSRGRKSRCRLWQGPHVARNPVFCGRGRPAAPASRRETPRKPLTHGHRAGPRCFAFDFNGIAAHFQIHDAPIVVSGAMTPSCDAAPCCERFLIALTLANASHYQFGVMWSTHLSGPGTRS